MTAKININCAPTPQLFLDPNLINVPVILAGAILVEPASPLEKFIVITDEQGNIITQG